MRTGPRHAQVFLNPNFALDIQLDLTVGAPTLPALQIRKALRSDQPITEKVC